MTARKLILLIVFLANATAAFALPIISPGVRPQPPAEPAPADKLYQRGLSHLVANDLGAAEHAFREALKLEAGSANAMLGLAEIAFRKKRPDDAATWIQSAIQAHPDNVDAHASLGRYLMSQHKYKQAETSLRKALALDARALRPRMDLAEMLAAQNRLNDAAAEYRQVTTNHPQHAGAHYALGLIAARLNDTAKATSALEESARLDPNNPLPVLAMARTQATQAQFDAALATVDKALKLQPSLVEALLLRGDVLNAMGQSTQALGAYQKAAAAAPNLAEPQMKIASTHHQAGQPAPAMAAYKKAIALDPKQAIAYNNLAILSIEANRDLDSAEAWARKAVGLGPKVGEFHDTLGWVQRARGKKTIAVATLRQASRLAPSNLNIQYHLALLLAETGHKNAAQQTLKKALALPGKFASTDGAKKLLADLAKESLADAVHPAGR